MQILRKFSSWRACRSPILYILRALPSLHQTLWLTDSCGNEAAPLASQDGTGPVAWCRSPVISSSKPAWFCHFFFVNDVTNVQSLWDFGDARMLLNSPMYLVLLNANIGVHIYIYYIYRHIYSIDIYTYDSHIYIIKNTYIYIYIVHDILSVYLLYSCKDLLKYNIGPLAFLLCTCISCMPSETSVLRALLAA